MKLTDYFKQSKFDTKKEFAERLGISQSLLTRWMNGERTPTLKRIPIIEKVTDRKVTLQDFIQ